MHNHLMTHHVTGIELKQIEVVAGLNKVSYCRDIIIRYDDEDYMQISLFACDEKLLKVELEGQHGLI